MFSHQQFNEWRFPIRAIDAFKMDKATFSVLPSFEEADEMDKAYWHSKTPRERLEALELMRQVNYDYNPVTDRLQRILEVDKLI